MTSAIPRRSSTDAAFRRPRRRLALLWLALVLLAGAGTARGAVAPVSPKIGDQARKILADSQYQRRLPGVPTGVKEQPGGGDQAERRRPDGDIPPVDGGSQVRMPVVPAELGAVAEMLLYLFLAVGAIFLAVALFRRLRASPPELAEPAAEAPPPQPERVERVPGLDDAERLASQGRWDEALHALLLQAIRVVSGRLPAPLPPSSTSRELLRLVPLSQEARQAFAGMVRAVELSLFGGTAVGAEVYEENRERFRIVSGRSG